jgi:hypothetical protein
MSCHIPSGIGRGCKRPPATRVYSLMLCMLTHIALLHKAVHIQFDTPALKMLLQPSICGLNSRVSTHSSRMASIDKLGPYCRILTNPDLLAQPDNTLMQ